MNLPTKPQVCVINGRLAVFMGADYKFLELQQASRFCRLVQSETARLRRELKQVRTPLAREGA